jgi:hypothetical protein
MTQEIITKLKDDVNYYGEFGKQFLSYSNIGTLLDNPKEFGKPTEPNANLLKGSFFHHLMLEPEKASEYIIVDATTRTTKAYKEACAEHDAPFLLLQKEADEIITMVAAAKKNFRFCSEVYEEGNTFEVPAIKEIFGHMWKGKADVVCADKVIDIKTTGRFKDFNRSARTFNYDAQAWLYNQLFGKRMVFFVIEKETCKMGVFECDDQFLERGKEKVQEALKVYEMFFSDTPTASIEQHIHEGVLY